MLFRLKPFIKHNSSSIPMNTKRRAVSPVIATVILIAVAVALGIAVAFWASGLTGAFSKYEKLGMNVQYAVSTSDCTSNPCWEVSLGGQNTGSMDSTITQIQINGVPYPLTGNVLSALKPSDDTQVVWNSSSTGSTTATSLSVKSGDTFSISLILNGNTGLTIPSKSFASGQTIQVVIITAAGNNYPASIVLP
jgi:flagellin-like protein